MTMRPFSLGELGRMQGTQQGAMQDVCVLEQWTAGVQDDYGVKASSYVDGAELVCGLDLTQNDLDEANSAETSLAEGRLRLPIDTQLDRRDRVRITRRFGVLLETPVRYELVGDPRRGPSGLVVNVRVVTNGQR